MSEKYCSLFVEDDVSGLRAGASLLGEEDDSVTAVSCPLRALEFDVTKVHLAVLDFDLPALNGFQLVLRLRAAHASFPIVLLSGMSRDVPNNMRKAFSSCLDKGEPIPVLLNTRNPTPGIQMLDGFNEGWIEFEGDTRKGRITLKNVLASMIDR